MLNKLQFGKIIVLIGMNNPAQNRKTVQAQIEMNNSVYQLPPDELYHPEDWAFYSTRALTDDGKTIDYVVTSQKEIQEVNRRVNGSRENYLYDNHFAKGIERSEDS